MARATFPKGAMGAPKMPAVYISKYNRFVDNIIGRINKILGKSYDPVRVKLQSYETKKKTPTTTKKKTKKKNNTRRRPTNNGNKKAAMTNKMAEVAIARSIESESREPAFILISKNSGVAPSKAQNRATPSKNKKKNTNTKATNNKKTPKARATLFGLSSIKRDGDVIVNMLSDHTMVKSNFIIGPLTLRVERELGRGAKRELKSATATTAEMHGRLNLKIVHGGAATLHMIKVLQPKQVRVESADNHEKTKEFMWRRSPHIATLVSQKLASAARSMLKPAPKV